MVANGEAVTKAAPVIGGILAPVSVPRADSSISITLQSVTFGSLGATVFEFTLSAGDITLEGKCTLKDLQGLCGSFQLPKWLVKRPKARTLSSVFDSKDNVIAKQQADFLRFLGIVLNDPLPYENNSIMKFFSGFTKGDVSAFYQRALGLLKEEYAPHPAAPGGMTVPIKYSHPSSFFCEVYNRKSLEPTKVLGPGARMHYTYIHTAFSAEQTIGGLIFVSTTRMQNSADVPILELVQRRGEGHRAPMMQWNGSNFYLYGLTAGGTAQERKTLLCRLTYDTPSHKDYHVMPQFAITPEAVLAGCPARVEESCMSFENSLWYVNNHPEPALKLKVYDNAYGVRMAANLNVPFMLCLTHAVSRMFSERIHNHPDSYVYVDELTAGMAKQTIPSPPSLNGVPPGKGAV